MGVTGWEESDRQTVRGDRPGCPRNDDKSTARNEDIGYLLDTFIEILRLEGVLVLLVDVVPVPESDAPPAAREDLDAGEDVPRVLRHRVRRMAAEVTVGLDLNDRLKVLVDRKVESDAREQL